MDFRPTELQRELAAGTRELLDARCTADVVRAAWDKPGTAAGLWASLAELGLPGALVPEAAGGLGLSVSDLVPALVETGRAAVPAPIVETALVAVPLLLAAGRDDLVAAIVAGDALVTAAPAGEPVPWVPGATHVLVLGEGAVLAVPGIRVPAVDGSRPLARLADDGAEELTVAAGDVAAARLRGALGTAAQLVGLGERQLAMTVDYTAQRQQFGAPVGSFQAVKHHLADALLGIRFAEPAVRAAALACDGDPGAGDLRRAVATAKALASDAADQVSRTAIQCHGAMGYTDEYDLQLYAKRTWALAAAWGTAADHRAVYADAVGPAAR
ncbi:acyl-CoA dehydrogenase family protein [Pseudonocardia ailaonensis]|uniref:Acyl-CoA dehydrogenase family protein n=1 Tax=Pseudonocardia ailaonensis TaxID=367279 RepID=A0ABN2N0D0_9PSEU